jgi:hypothetical protein
MTPSTGIRKKSGNFMLAQESAPVLWPMKKWIQNLKTSMLSVLAIMM